MEPRTTKAWYESKTVLWIILAMASKALHDSGWLPFQLSTTEMAWIIEWLLNGTTYVSLMGAFWGRIVAVKEIVFGKSD